MLTEISSKLYSEYITSTLEITEKLDLATFKQEENETVSNFYLYLQDVHMSLSLKFVDTLFYYIFFWQNDTADNSDVATSDPISGLNAKTPKDFQVREYFKLEIAMLMKDLHINSRNFNKSNGDQLIFLNKKIDTPLILLINSDLRTLMKM